MADRPPLSPAAQAVLDAAVRRGVELAVEQGLRGSCRNAEANMKAEIAAALCAAASQVIEEVSPVEAILAIAAELDSTQPTSGGDFDG